MSRAQAETERTRANLIQLGTVAELVGARLRVQLGALLTAPLDVLRLRAGSDRDWWQPDLGEQVAVLCPDGEPAGGLVLGAIDQTAYPAVSTSPDVHRRVYADGADIQYDRAAHALTATLPAGGTVTLTAPGGVTVHAAGGVTVHAAAGAVLNAAGGITMTGNTMLYGTLTVSNLITAQNGIVSGAAAGGVATFHGDIQVNGSITSTEDQVADGVSQIGHVHGGVTAGSANTGAPVT